MQLIQLTNHVYYTDCDHKRDRPILGYIKGSKCAVMVDAGNSAAQVQEFQKALGDLPLPSSCLITHWHWDHTFGMHALGCKTIAAVEAKKELERLGQWEWTDSTMKARLATGEEIAFADEHIRAEYADLSQIKVVGADFYLEKDEVIDCGEVSCRCIKAPSAHSDDSLMVLVPEEEVLFLGDCYNDDFYHDHNRDLKQTKALYEMVNRLRFKIAVPGHGAPIKKEQILRFLGSFLE